METIELNLRNHADTTLALVCLFKACTTEIYGLGCNEKCGNCRNASDCFHVNGTCLSGCVPGYSDHQCKTRKNIFYATSLFDIDFCFRIPILSVLCINIYRMAVLTWVGYHPGDKSFIYHNDHITIDYYAIPLK